MYGFNAETIKAAGDSFVNLVKENEKIALVIAVGVIVVFAVRATGASNAAVAAAMAAGSSAGQ